MFQGKFTSKPLWHGTDFYFSNVYDVIVQPYPRSYLYHGHILQVLTLFTLEYNLNFNVCTKITKKFFTHVESYLYNKDI